MGVAAQLSNCGFVSHGDRTATFARLDAIGVFWLFGAVTACLAGITLGWPGTVLDRIWVLNPRAYHELAPFGRRVDILFLVLALALALAGMGWLQRKVWGWWLAVILLCTQTLGNLVNLFMGHSVEGGVGLAIAGALLVYLVRTDVRCAFGAGVYKGSD
jgi:hypothetical protein